LFRYDNIPIGWAWVSYNNVTIDCIHSYKKVDGVYVFNIFVTKGYRIGKRDGYYMYIKMMNYLFEKVDSVYWYVDDWNSSPINISMSIGARKIDSL